jgi:hypothetical protein
VSQISRSLYKVVNTEPISQTRDCIERARAACQFAEDWEQRAARLILQAGVLTQRFDELEQTMLVRTSALAQHFLGGCWSAKTSGKKAAVRGAMEFRIGGSTPDSTVVPLRGCSGSSSATPSGEAVSVFYLYAACSSALTSQRPNGNRRIGASLASSNC